MSKTAVDAARAGTVFALPPEDDRFVLVNDKSSPLYDERLELPVSEELALSIAREGQIQSGKVRKNGPKLEILDGRQRYRAALLANKWIGARDPRVAFRAGQIVQFKFEVVRPEDERDAVRKMKTYLRCPRQYELKYVRGVEAAFVPIALAFGSAFHAALAFFYGMLKEAGAEPSLDETAGIFTDAWRNAADGPLPLHVDEDDDGDAKVDYEAKGAAMLAVFHAQAALPEGAIVEAVEQSFAVELHDPDTGIVLEEKLVGAWDLLLRESDKLIVVEHKTSARKYTLDQIRFDQQPTAYKLAARQLGLGEVALRFQIVTKTKVPAVHMIDLVRDARDEDDWMRTVLGVLRAIDAGAFYPVRGWQCRGCQYAHACTGRK